MNADAWVLALTAVGAAVFGGAMFAFSTFVMPALRELAPRDGIVAMQAINRWAPRSLLALPMGLLAIGGVAVIVLALVGDGPDRGLRLAGAVLALASLAITGLGNVPINTRVDALAAAPESEDAWAAYSTLWGRWNHLRTIASLAGAILLAVAAARA